MFDRFSIFLFCFFGAPGEVFLIYYYFFPGRLVFLFFGFLPGRVCFDSFSIFFKIILSPHRVCFNSLIIFLGFNLFLNQKIYFIYLVEFVWRAEDDEGDFAVAQDAQLVSLLHDSKLSLVERHLEQNKNKNIKNFKNFSLANSNYKYSYQITTIFQSITHL